MNPIEYVGPGILESNKEYFQSAQYKCSIQVALGIILALGALFFCLSSHIQIPGLNALSDLGAIGASIYVPLGLISSILIFQALGDCMQTSRLKKGNVAGLLQEATEVSDAQTRIAFHTQAALKVYQDGEGLELFDQKFKGSIYDDSLREEVSNIHLLIAETAYEAKKFALAIKYFSAVGTGHLSFSHQVLLLDSYLKVNDLAAAGDLVSKCFINYLSEMPLYLSFFSKQNLGTFWELTAQHFFAQRNYSYAASYFSKALTLKPLAKHELYLLVTSLIFSAQLAALSNLLKTLNSSQREELYSIQVTNGNTYWTYLGEAESGLKNLEMAENCFKKIDWKKFEYQPPAHFLHAQLYLARYAFEQKKYDIALTAFTRSGSNKPEDQIRKALCLLETKLDSIQEVEPLIEKINIESIQPENQKLLARIWLRCAHHYWLKYQNEYYSTIWKSIWDLSFDFNQHYNLSISYLKKALPYLELKDPSLSFLESGSEKYSEFRDLFLPEAQQRGASQQWKESALFYVLLMTPEKNSSFFASPSCTEALSCFEEVVEKGLKLKEDGDDEWWLHLIDKAIERRGKLENLMDPVFIDNFSNKQKLECRDTSVKIYDNNQFVFNMGWKLHFLKGNLLESMLAKKQLILKEYELAWHLHPNNPFGCGSYFMIDDQVKDTDKDRIDFDIEHYKKSVVTL